MTGWSVLVCQSAEAHLLRSNFAQWRRNWCWPIVSARGRNYAGGAGCCFARPRGGRERRRAQGTMRGRLAIRG
eukprot:3841331-Alexandrium_andersonii.AAC.1